MPFYRISASVSIVTLGVQVWDTATKTPIIAEPSKIDIPTLIIDRDSLRLKIQTKDSAVYGR